MARDYFDESKKKKTTTQKAATKTKSQSSSVAKPKATTSKATKAASKSTFLGGGASTQKVQQANKKPSTVKKPATTKKTVTQQERINQKMYGSTTAPERRTKTPASNAQRKTNAEANLNLKQTAAQTSRTRLAETETQRRAAQTQKMTAGVDATKARAQTREIGNEIRRSVTDSLSADNRAFAQRQKSGTLTEEDKKKVEQRDQRRAQIAKNTGAVAWKAAQDTVSGYGQSLADVDEMVKSNKNWTKAKAQKMGIDLNDKAKVSKVEQERQQSIKEAREFRQELFNKQEKRQAEWDERTKNAKGLEKAWYGAVESGTGMLADTAVGAVTGTGQFGALASMGLRTYGSSANQARKEGATDKEARLYGLAQSAKEVGTELMFQGAGLAKAAYGKTGLSLADKSANVLTRGLTGIKADAVGAGVRALGGTAEENIEELAGWMADPLIKELTYGKAVRNRMKENLRANIPQIGSDADAANVASYFSTPKFTDDLTKEYVKSGMSKDKASALAAEMRDYYVAYYSGDQGKVDALEEDLAAKLSGQDKLSYKSWSMDELKDTFASTTLLTLATGIPGAVNTSVKGNQIFDSDEVKAVFGNDAVRKVADAVKNTSNKEMSLKAEVMKQRLDSGKDLTGTQKFDLYQGYIEKVNETSKKARASYGVVENAREEQDLVPTMGVDRAGNTVYAKETQKEYNEKFASTELTVEAIKNYMESDNSISDDESRRANAVKKAVADLHVGGLTVGDVHEFAYGNDLAREALKAEEGIDLDRYVVRRADGTVDLAATNEATENALFQINADNAIKAAQAETEVYIDDTRGNIDKDLLTRFGNSGQAAWKEVNKDLDPRDLKNYLTTANAASYFYSAGRNTDMSVDTAINRYADTFKTVDNSVLEKAFAAGAEDRIIANTPGYGQTVEAGSNIQLKKTEPVITGQLIMDDDVVLADSDQSAYLALAMSTNTNIHIVGTLSPQDANGNAIINEQTGLPVQLNGMSHGNDIYLNMNASAEQNLGYVFMHEMTHQIKQYAPNEYLALENLVRDKWFNKDAVGMQAAIKQRMDLYSVKGGQQLTEEEAVEEIIADAMAEAMDDPNFAAEVCEQDINLGQQILDSIRAALRSIRQIFANSDVKNDRFHNSLLSYLGILDEAEKMWIDALHTARLNKADGLIADWQDKANKQNAPRLSVTEVSDEELERIKAKKRTNKRDREILRDAGEKLKENDFYNLYTAHIINLGGKGKNADQMVESIKENGFKGSGGFGVNLVDSSINNIRRQTEEEIRADFTQYGIPEDRIEEKINQLKETTSGPNRWIDGAYYEGINVTVDRYGGRKGQTVMFVPEHHTTDDRSLVETGFKPFDYEVVKVERDFQPYYELYSKAYDEAHEGRYSITPQQDADYMKAVESGDMETAQMMVDEAARNAGYTVEAFHGTKANFNKFRKNSHFGSTVYQALDRLGFYNDILDEYEDDPEVEELLSRARDEENAKVMRLHIKAENPIRLRDLGSWDSEELREGLNEVGIDLPTDYKGADIVNALKGLGYDSIVYENLREGRYEDEGENDAYILFDPRQAKLADPVTYDDNGNVIPLSERFNTESQDIRFSLSEPVERVADLIAVHNLKPDDIRNTFELGGFPMPSIAITKDSMGHDLYGDITLMFHSDTVDPEFFRSNQVFGGDAWTPTFPTIAKKVSRKVADKVDKKLKDILGLGQYDYTLGDLRLPSLDDDNLTNALRYNEPYEAFKNDEVFQIAYLKNAKNFDVAVPTKEGRIRSFDKQALEYLDDNLPELTYNDIYDTVDHTMQYEPAVRKARKDYYENKGGVKLKALAKHLEEAMGYSDVISRLEALIKFREEGIPEVTDHEALKKILDENVDQEGYKAWIDNLFEGIIEKTGIRNDKDMFTSSGNRRSWESLHDPVTLENVVKVMKSELAAGSGIFGGNPKGAAQKQYKSLDEIRADEDRLQSLPEEGYEALSKEAVGKMSEVCVSIAEHNPKRFTNSFGAALDVGSDIAEILNSTRNRDTIQRKLKKDYWLDVTDEQMDDLMEAIDAIANLPTGYFEAKPRRAVGFDEVRAAVIPANTDADIKEGFSKRGITTYEYDPEVEGDRTAKVNDAASEQDLRFSISENSSGESLTEWQQEYFRNSKIVDEDGRLKIMYHGTPNMGFTVFDLKKAKPGTLGRGFYFTDSKTHAGNHGQQMEVYLNIENPLQPDTYDITKEQLRQFVAALAEDEDYGIDNYGYDATVDSVTDSVWGRSDFQMLHDLNLTCVGDLAEACRLFNYVNGTNYDGIVTAVETLAMRPEQIKLTDNLAPTSDPDIRFSVSDDEYLSAVEKYQQMYDANEWGWLQAEDEIQRMVDQAAVEAGYATKAYHGTDAEFNVFKRDYIAHGRLYGDGFYFSPLEEIAGSYGSNVKPYFLKTGVLTERELMSDYLAAQDYKDFADKDDAIAFSREKRQQFEKYGQGIERFRPDVDIVQGMYRVIYTTVGAFQNGYIMVATEPEYIKSAEPIVKDDNGNVIPLSKRFNDNSVDTRFSISATDSQGNRLTEEQRQYFGNSQAVDDQGRLVPVYHTTNYGGFTIFDPSYSDDKRSLFFASNWDVSQTYGRNANKPIDIYNNINSASTSTLIDRVNNTTAWNIDRIATEEDFANEIKRMTLSDDDAKKYGLSKDRVEKSKEYVKTLKDMLERMRSGEDFFYSEYNSIGHSYGANSLIATKQEVIDLIQSYGKGSQGYYSCYLNLENPLIVDAKGHNWNDIPYGPEGNSLEDHLVDLEERADMVIRSIMAVQGGYDDNGFAHEMNVYIKYRTKDKNGEWSSIQTFRDSVGISDRQFDDESELSSELWERTEDILLNFGLPMGYVNDLEAGCTDYDGDIVWTEDERGDDIPFDYIMHSEGQYEIVDRWSFDNEETYRTRELAELAEEQGYDGVIIRNCVDLGGTSKLKTGASSSSDIFIAFSSNQVKDVANENPTENPDIRYSIVDEDEAMSHMAHDYAYDTSYEALAYYEDLIAADASTETTYEKAKNYIAKDVDEFYAGLTRYADGMKFDDPVLEEGRTRMARSKQDYFNSNVAKWNDAWLTDGEVLDPKSIKKPVRDLVMAVMSESNTNKKYKTDLVNKAIIDIRLAYFYAKKGRTDVADALLWHSAHRMIDGVEFYADDTSYEEYKGLRDYMKNTRIQLGEEYWSDVDFGAFRKENFGRMNLVKGETNVDKIYAELEDMYPGLFDSEEYDNAPDQLMHMASVLDSVQPYAEAYSSEYCAEWATDIASDLLDIMQNGKELQSIADRYTNKYEAKIKAMKARHAEAMLKVRQQRDEGINAQKAKFKEYKEQQKEKRAHDKSFESIQKTHKKLTERLLTNTADKNIPEQYKRDLARLLAAFDLQTVGSKKYEMRTGRQGQKTIKMAALKTALTNIENKSHEFHVSDAITDIIDELLGKDAGNGYGRSIEGLTIDELSASELDRIDKLLKALLHEFNTYRNVKIGAKRQQTEDIGKAQVDSALEHAKMFGAGKDYQNIPGGIDRIINLDEVTPAYMFKHIDPEKSGLGLMFKELRRSFDKYVKNQEQLNEWMNDIVGKYHKRSKLPWKKYGAGELENWRSENYAQTFNLENGPVTLTPAQMMSLYCLSKRTQAYNHMTGAGIVVAPVSFNAKIMSDLKKKPNTALPVKLTDADIKQIVAQLTPDQIKVADDLQQLMAERMAAWGNEASMNVLGIELFGEPDYFPIKSDKAALEKDLNENEFVEAIRNFGFTKAVQPGARNAIMVDDIFNVVTEHCNNMNLYNAYSEALNDFMKVYNYRDFRDDGSEYTVQQAIAHAYGSKATTFIMTFMRDLNGNVSGRASGIENLYNSLLGNAKKAAVFANLRVAAQQPTAITRAFAVIDPKYLKGIKIENGAMDELFEHCPIALWKSWGYYDINMGKSIEDIMMNNGRWLEDAATEIYGALDNVTWTAIWQMVKAEMKDTHPDVKVGSDEYWELCNERMTEVVDLTQVVDSPFHRSHAMRDKGIFIKAATSFMAEPTLTFNMLRDGVIRSREAWKKGDKAEAAKIAARIGAVALLQAATVAGAASLVDALRKKRPDKDDEDERFLHLWWVNALENFRDEMKVWNKIYFVKDIASIFDGWDNSNLALQGIQKFALGYRQLTEDPYARSSATWYENMADGIGYMTGVPVKTVRTGLKNAMTMLGVSVSALDSVGEKLDSVSLKNEDGETGMIGKLLGLVLSDDEDSLLDKYAEKKGYKKVEKNDEDTGSEKTSESGEAEETEKREQLDYDTMLNKALKAAEGYEGEEYNQRIYSSVAQGMKGYIADGDYVSIGMMRTVIEQAGGDVNYFDQRVMEETKSAYKKSLNYDMSYEERWDQKAMYRYMMQHGMSQEELSSEVLYKSDLAKDMKVAYRIGDNDTIYEAMLPLVDAGITETDLERLYENRNRMDLTKYKQNGRFKDKLKSMGTFIWPTDGVITSHFGYRNAPTAGASSNHPAIDIGAPQGTSVVAADGGVIIYAGTNSGYGNSVGIKHDNGMVTYYNHLYAYNVKVGDTVAQGQQIAQVGSTGISTGPHLDFKILDKNGKPVDPEKYLQ